MAIDAQPRLTALIVDDEPAARLFLRKRLAESGDIAVIGEFDDGSTALPAILAARPDLLFLDIQMRKMHGFEVLARMPEDYHPAIIFVTAYDRYAVAAFDAAAVDYLLKPVSNERFIQALERARERLKTRQIKAYNERLLSILEEVRNGNERVGSRGTSDLQGSHIVVKTGNRLVFVEPADIDWIEAEGVYVCLHVGDKKHLLRESLQRVEERLSSSMFLRIHRSTLVNTTKIKEVIPHMNGGSIVVLQDGRRLKMSRSYRERLSVTLG